MWELDIKKAEFWRINFLILITIQDALGWCTGWPRGMVEGRRWEGGRKGLMTVLLVFVPWAIKAEISSWVIYILSKPVEGILHGFGKVGWSSREMIWRADNWLCGRCLPCPGQVTQEEFTQAPWDLPASCQTLWVRTSGSTSDGISRFGMPFLWYFIPSTSHVTTRNYFDVVLTHKAWMICKSSSFLIFLCNLWSSSTSYPYLGYFLLSPAMFK